MLRNFVGSIIIVLLFVIAVNGQSHRPPPSPGELSKPVQKQSTSKQQPSKNDQRGTEQSPLVVKTINPPKTEAETNQEREDREEKAANDWKLVWFTALLVFVTAVLAGVAVWQGYQMRRSVESQCHADRAHVFVKVRLNPSNEHASEIIRFGTDQPTEIIPIEVIAANHGKTPAILMSVIRIVDVFDDNKLDKVFYQVTSEFTSTIVPGAELIDSVAERALNVHFFMDDNKRQLITNQANRIVCFGCIQYKDIFGASHDTVFCWEYQDLIENFYPNIKDTKRNYRT